MQKRIVIILALVVVAVLVVGGVYLSQQKNNKLEPGNQVVDNNQNLVGGDKDEHGCIGSAGYTWCEAKQKCLRVWEEPCADEDALRIYLNDNLSELSPEKEVLGGKFYVTDIKIISPGKARVEYEDGHIALAAEFDYIYQAEQVSISNFILVPLATVSGNDEDIAKLVTEISQGGNTDFVYQGMTLFEWISKVDDDLERINLLGEKYSAKNVSSENFAKLEKYLRDNLQADLYTVADGTLSGLAGYTTDGLACVFKHDFARQKEDENGMIVIDGDGHDIDLSCAKFSLTDSQAVKAKVALEKVFMDKYGKSLGQIVVSLGELQGDYARGGVHFAPFGQPAGGGMVLAYRQDGQWQLAFDGNGSFSCQMLEDLGFPKDFQEGCYGE